MRVEPERLLPPLAFHPVPIYAIPPKKNDFHEDTACFYALSRIKILALWNGGDQNIEQIVKGYVFMKKLSLCLCI